jgi:hypothetical protein
MSPKQLLPLAIMLALGQLLPGAWQHARRYDARLDLYTVDFDRPPIMVARPRLPDWFLAGLHEEVSDGALEDPEVSMYERLAASAP